MEPIEIFIAAVLIVGAIHLVVTAGACIPRWWNEMFPRKKLSMRQRSDWYVFFHCSDLVGPEARPHPQVSQDSVVHSEKRKQPTRRLSVRAEVRR